MLSLSNGQTIVLSGVFATKSIATLGRHVSADISFPALAESKSTVYKGISQNHAEIELRDWQLFLRDRNSKNGTFLNDSKLEPMAWYTLKEGDIITLGWGVYVCSKTGTVKNPYALTLHGLDYFISHMKQRLEDTNKTVDDMHGIEWKDPQNSQTKAGQHTHELQVSNQLPTSTAMPRTGAAVAEAALPQTQSNMRTQQVPKSSRDAQPMEDVIDLTGDDDDLMSISSRKTRLEEASTSFIARKENIMIRPGPTRHTAPLVKLEKRLTSAGRTDAQKNNTARFDTGAGVQSNDVSKARKDLLHTLPGANAIEQEFVCPICHDMVYPAYTARCSHIFCGGCLAAILSDRNLGRLCPVCRNHMQGSAVSVPTIDICTEEMIRTAGTAEEQIARKGKIDDWMANKEKYERILKGNLSAGYRRWSIPIPGQQAQRPPPREQHRNNNGGAYGFGVVPNQAPNIHAITYSVEKARECEQCVTCGKRQMEPLAFGISKSGEKSLYHISCVDKSIISDSITRGIEFYKDLPSDTRTEIRRMLLQAQMNAHG